MTTTAAPLALVRDLAEDLDTGAADVRPVLRELGAAGLLGPAGEPLGDAVALVRAVAARSLAAGFALWSQRMVLEYLGCCPAPGAAGAVAALRAGDTTGATALAPAIADLAGGPPLPLLAEPEGGGWRLTGTVGWASNLFDDALVVAPARTVAGGRVVVAFRRTDAGVTATPPYALLGLNGTGTGGLVLDGVAVPAGLVLSDDLAGFLARCGPPMLLLQTALALGVADAALDSAAAHLPGTGLDVDHAALAGRRDEVARATAGRAGGGVVAPAGPAAGRLAAVQVAGDAVRLEVVLAGGGGYRTGSGTARRVREAAFLPVQAPTAVQLRR
ncbi:hypothetical protein [Trujillonella endophytica]|uniref:Acyl-CoA dehydrogenase n=1 Tax=Trujillonella endophytica TaxID=673521 RepID=A0A1H8S8X4_9ACTN|nr:hypothetical protein [Trujillella endophytica]SEO75111.1 Acyl-CoA dehydrogenase [Trujillella endophytica]